MSTSSHQYIDRLEDMTYYDEESGSGLDDDNESLDINQQDVQIKSSMGFQQSGNFFNQEPSQSNDTFDDRDS